MKTKIRRASGLLVVFAVFVLPFIAWTQRWFIYDYLRLRGYKPPAEIVQLAADTTLNAKTRSLFYVYYPSLEDKSDFNNNCKTGEKTIVLGCYVSGQGIYLYNVTDERLNGIIQVTAAHETLHAAYDRLSQDEKSHIDNLTQQVYKSINNPRINESISEYQKNGADVANELHSIIGTEVRDLPPELETYYARYFDNRLKIVEYSEKYEQAFADRKASAEQYLAKMDALKPRIDVLNSELGNKKSELNSQLASLKSQRSNVANVEEYNAQVDNYNSQVTSFNVKVQQVATLIQQYNTYLEKYNVIADEENQLIKAIDSRPDTLPTQ